MSIEILLNTMKVFPQVEFTQAFSYRIRVGSTSNILIIILTKSEVIIRNCTYLFLSTDARYSEHLAHSNDCVSILT